MKIIVTGKNLEVGDTLRKHVESAIDSLVERFFGDILEVHVNFNKDNFRFVCDISSHVSRHFIVRTRFEDTDAYRAFEQALNKMESRIQRYRSRLRNRKRHNPDKEIGVSDAALQYVINGSTPLVETNDDSPLIIAEMDVSVPTVSVSDAVMELDLTDQAVIMFRNSSTGELSVVYRRTDGNIGWIDPSIRTQ